MSDTQKINYAKASGYQSEAAAIVVALLYVPLSFFFLFISLKKRVRDYIILTIFCHSEYSIQPILKMMKCSR